MKIPNPYDKAGETILARFQSNAAPDELGLFACHASLGYWRSPTQNSNFPSEAYGSLILSDQRLIFDTFLEQTFQVWLTNVRFARPMHYVHRGLIVYLDHNRWAAIQIGRIEQTPAGRRRLRMLINELASGVLSVQPKERDDRGDRARIRSAIANEIVDARRRLDRGEITKAAHDLLVKELRQRLP